MLTSMKGEINNNTIIVGDFNTQLTPMDRSTKQKINKETQTLNDTTDQLDLTDIDRSDFEEIPHNQGQGRSPSRTVGGARSHLESNPIPARDAQRAQTNLVHTRTQRPHRD